MSPEKHRALAAGAAAPLLVALGLIVLMLLSPVTGMVGPSSNTYFLAGAAAIASGTTVGIASLIMMKHTRKWVRFLVGLTYAPTVLLSLLLIGA